MDTIPTGINIMQLTKAPHIRYIQCPMCTKFQLLPYMYIFDLWTMDMCLWNFDLQMTFRLNSDNCTKCSRSYEWTVFDCVLNLAIYLFIYVILFVSHVSVWLRWILLFIQNHLPVFQMAFWYVIFVNFQVWLSACVEI